MKDFNIVYCCNNFNTSSLVDSIDSILKHIAVKNTINFHILGLDISQENKDRVGNLIDSYNVHSDNNVIFLDDDIKQDYNKLGDADKGDSSVEWQFNVRFYKPQLYKSNNEKMAFYKENFCSLMNGMPSLYQLFLQDIFSNLDSCLFLNYDVRARHCISKIFNFDIDNYLAIVSKYKGKNIILSHDSILLFTKDDESISNFCKYFKRKSYFDAGMMLLNLRKMREREISQQLYAYALHYSRSEYGECVDSPESILNLGLGDEVKVVSF